MTATWRKQPPIPSRQNIGVRNQPVFVKTRTCRRCKVEIEAPLRYCWTHYNRLTDIEKDNLRRMS